MATLAQQAESHALICVCTWAKDKTANINTDSRYAFRVAQDFGTLGKQHGFLISSENNIKSSPWGFPGGAVVENLPANAGDTGSSPGLGRSHMPQSNWGCEPQLLSLCSGAREPQLLSPRVPRLLKPAHLEPVFRNKRRHCNEKPARAPRWRVAPRLL